MVREDFVYIKGRFCLHQEKIMSTLTKDFVYSDIRYRLYVYTDSMFASVDQYTKEIKTDV